MSRMGLGIALWPAFVLGVAAQLQQARLGPFWGYGLAAAVGGLIGAWLWRCGRLGGWRGWLVGGLAGTVAAALIGWAYTGWRATLVADLAMPPALQGQDLTLTGRVASLPQRGSDGLRFVFEADGSRPAGVPPRLLLGWYWRGAPPDAATLPRAGERWQLTVRLRNPHGQANPHGFDRERWLWENGLAATGYVRLGPRDPVPRRLQSAGPGLDAARQAVSEAIEARVTDPRSAGVLVALVVGDQSAIDRADWALFRTTGVAHLMSISGLHITLFAWLATRFVGALWRRLARSRPALLLAVPLPLAAGLGGVMLATAYALFSGWGVPAQRTVLMLGLVVGLRLLGRHWPWWPLWGLAMVAVLLLDPWALLQAGFWLSFVAVGILFATDPAGRSVQPGSAAPAPRVRLGRAVAGLVREQGVMTLALAPLSLLLFGQVSVVGLVANLLAIPWVTLLVTPLAFAGVLLPVLWDLAAWALLVLMAWLEWLAQVGWAAVFRPIPPWPLAWLAVVGGVLLVLRLPGVLRSGGLLLIWPALLWQPARPPAGEFEVMAIDVGQGSAVLLRTARHTLLYDAGPRFGSGSDAGERIVLPLLRALGEAPDTVVISHSDGDHAGGAEAVRAAWPQARWLSSFDTDPGRRCLAGLVWDWDGVRFEMLHPAADLIRADGSGRLPSNAMSCVLRVDNGRRSAWLSGDLDAERETRLALAQPGLRADLLLAPHHGSASSSSPVLLNTLRPSVVLIQSGYRNRFGHPAPVVLQRYRERGMQWFESPLCGAATWRSAVPAEVRCERAQNRRYWHHAGADPASGEAASSGKGADRSAHSDGSATQ